MKIECTENQKAALLDIVLKSSSTLCYFADENNNYCYKHEYDDCIKCFMQEVEWVIKD